MRGDIIQLKKFIKDCKDNSSVQNRVILYGDGSEV